jgi:hypothetical protein
MNSRGILNSKPTYLRHRAEESSSDTLLVRRRRFGNEKCASREDKVTPHGRSDRSDKAVGPVRRRRVDDGEEETSSSGHGTTHTCMLQVSL